MDPKKTHKPFRTKTNLHINIDLKANNRRDW